MVRNIFLGVCCCICFTLTQAAYAQDTLPVNQISIKFSPQHLLFKGMHLDVEKSVGVDGRQSIILSPRFYNGSTRQVDNFTRRRDQLENQSRVIGYGAEVQHRFYRSGTSHQGVYLVYGVNYHHFEMEFMKQGWLMEVGEDGLEYYKYRDRPFHEKISRWGAVAMMGMQRPLLIDRMLVDLYVGFGYTHSSITTDYSFIRYNINAYDYGYTGTYFLGGLKLGVLL